MRLIEIRLQRDRSPKMFLRLAQPPGLEQVQAKFTVRRGVSRILPKSMLAPLPEDLCHFGMPRVRQCGEIVGQRSHKLKPEFSHLIGGLRSVHYTLWRG